MVGLSGVEPLTSRLSGVRSNQLSYRPKSVVSVQSWSERVLSQPANIKKSGATKKSFFLHFS